jgi:hypothetical protein
LPINLGGINYSIIGIVYDGLVLQEQFPQKIITRFYQLGDHNLNVILNDEEFSVSSVEKDVLHLRNLSNGSERYISLSDIKNLNFLSENTINFIDENSTLYFIEKISDNTDSVCLSPITNKPSDLVYKITETTTFTFEALLKNRIGKGAFIISVQNGNLLARHPKSDESFLISLEELAPTFVDFNSSDFGLIQVDTISLFRDNSNNRRLASQNSLDRGIGTIEKGDVSFGTTEEDIREKIKFLNRIGPESPCFIFTIGMVLDEHEPLLRDLISWFESRKNNSVGVVHVISNLTKSHKSLDTQRPFEELGIKVHNIFSVPGNKTPIIAHAKFVVGETTEGLPIGRLDTGCFRIFKGFTKIDISLILPTEEAKLLFDYVKAKYAFNPNPVFLDKQLRKLAKHGILINDPEQKIFMLNRGMRQLIREAKKSLNLHFSELDEESFTKELVNKANSGIKISIIVHDIGYDSAKLLYPLFLTEKLTFENFYAELTDLNKSKEFFGRNISLLRVQRRKDNPAASPMYFHYNSICSDCERIYIGTSYPWCNTLYSEVLSEGRSFESGFIASGDLAKAILIKMEAYERISRETIFPKTMTVNSNYSTK